jgi:lipopolysaccharide/colanic/teichoic acid biosynthesis glycosyltransferase
LDLFLLAVSLPVTLPVMMFIALWVRLLSKGPIFFVQERVGYGGKRFGCMKFRTMYHGACASQHEKHLAQILQAGGPMVKLDAVDPRLLPGARFIRALGLDELPQLINVLRGEMSWVGPRPCTPFELERYTPAQLERFAALPGLSGLWQVRGKNRTTFSEMVALDIEYVRTPSLWRDVVIMALTPKTLVDQILQTIGARRRLAHAAGRLSTAANDVGLRVGSPSVATDIRA